MLNNIIRLVLLALALLLVAWMIPGITINGFIAALVAAVVIGMVNFFIRPLVMILTIPINILTLGLFTFVVNALLFWLVGAVVPGFEVAGFLPALFGSIFLSFLSMMINWASKEPMHAH